MVSRLYGLRVKIRNVFFYFSRYEAKQFCESIGAEMLLIERAQEQKFMSQYFSEWQRAGVTRMWQRISDISTSYPKPNDQCEWTNAQNGYDQWGSHEPKCRKESNSCGYFTTSASAENWATDYCSKPEAFSCQVRAGSMIHAIPKARDQPTSWFADWSGSIRLMVQ